MKAPPHFIVSENDEGLRLDNFILRQRPSAPRAMAYRLIRTKHIRINKKRAQPDSRLCVGDCVNVPESIYRLPKVAVLGSERPLLPPLPLDLPVLYEDAHLLAVDKPAGIAVHGGSGMAHGVIERLRAQHSEGSGSERFLELVHRLDKATSGVLLLAKKRSALRAVQAQWRAKTVHKAYYALVFGEWLPRHRHINKPLKRRTEDSGNRQVVIDEAGKPSQTATAVVQQWAQTALVAAEIATGRMHQIRAHLASVGLPIVGDNKYGDFLANRKARHIINKVMRNESLYLHAHCLRFKHPQSDEVLTIESPLPPEFYQLAEALEAQQLTKPS